MTTVRLLEAAEFHGLDTRVLRKSPRNSLEKVGAKSPTTCTSISSSVT